MKEQPDSLRTGFWRALLPLGLAVLALTGCGGQPETPTQVSKPIARPAPAQPTARPAPAPDTQAQPAAQPAPVEAEEPEEVRVSKLLTLWEEEGAKFTFQPEGRTDPFMPVVTADQAAPRPREEEDRPRSPLERMELSSLSLVAVITAEGEAKALVEDTTGMGYIVEEGTLIGTNNGRIVGIYPTVKSTGGIKETVEPAHIEVQEDYMTYFGNMKQRVVVIPLRGEEK